MGVDGSAEAREAVRQGARLSSAMDAALDLVHVLDPVGGRWPAEARERTRRLLEAAARLAAELDAEGATRMLVGDPATLLQQETRERWGDLLCVGAGAGTRLGRVGRAALHAASCSVLIAREGPRTARFPGRVLCAVDGSPSSLEAARQAAGIAAVGGAGLRLLHVLGEPQPGGIVSGEAVLEQGAAAARGWGVEPTREMTIGPPATAILEVAEAGRADLLVVGWRGLGRMGRLLLGSVSERVAAAAETSVLVARPRPA